MRKHYEDPEMEVVLFDDADIVCGDSGGIGDDDDESERD